jgi:hypothetical protein
VLARFAQNAKIPFVDTSAVLTQGPDAESNYLRYAPRWSPTGHRKVAEYVAGNLTENLPGPWNGLYVPQEEQPLSKSHTNPIQWLSGQQQGTKPRFPENLAP